jgi:parallel beta-helix repeat protein
MKKILVGIVMCLLMIISMVLPVSATVVQKTITHQLTTGNILYAGGLGPNNYTKIQDAINDAGNGDTIFVYDDSSPYNESVVITKSISLIGEDKQTTIIDGGKTLNEPVINITADGVMVQGFTIQNKWTDIDNGIMISSNNNLIKDNIIKDNSIGILLNGWIPGIPHYSNSSIVEDNDIYENHETGVYVIYSYFNTISNNRISSNTNGIYLGLSRGNLVTLNNITKNEETGIWIYSGINNTILKNNILNNHFGIDIFESSYNSVLQNNIYKNVINTRVRAFMIEDVLLKLKSFNQTWDGNYWGRTYQSSKPIFGSSVLVLPSWLISAPISFLTFLFFEYTFSIPIGLPVIKFDLHPAQEPYDIPPAGV